MIETKIRKGTFQHVESELYVFNDTRKEIIRLKNEILYASPEPNRTGGGRSNIPSDPTGSTATLLVSHRKIEQLEMIVDAIQTVYDQLPEKKQRMLKLKYWTRPQTLTWDGIALRLDVGRATAIRWRDEIVYAISEILGWR